MVLISYSAQIVDVKDLLAKIKLCLESVCTFYKVYRNLFVQCRKVNKTFWTNLRLRIQHTFDMNFDIRPHNIVFGMLNYSKFEMFFYLAAKYYTFEDS